MSYECTVLLCIIIITFPVCTKTSTKNFMMLLMKYIAAVTKMKNSFIIYLRMTLAAHESNKQMMFGEDSMHPSLV